LQPGAGGCKPQRPHIEKFLQAKQFVFIDVFVRSPAYNKLKTPTNGGRQSFSRTALQNQKLLGRAWCGHARPTVTFAPAKFGAGKFCRFKEQKRKFSREVKYY